GISEEALARGHARGVPELTGVDRPEPQQKAPAARHAVACGEDPGQSRRPDESCGAVRIDQTPGLSAVVGRIDPVLAARPPVELVGEAAVLGERALVAPDETGKAGCEREALHAADVGG